MPNPYARAAGPLLSSANSDDFLTDPLAANETLQVQERCGGGAVLPGLTSVSSESKDAEQRHHDAAHKLHTAT